MFKNLLLTLVLLPFLCFSQYEWTDKGDYKILEYENYIRQIGYSVSGDSLLITDKQRIDVFNSDGEFISTIENNIERSENSISFTSDKKNYIFYDYQYHYDNADLILKAYDFKNNELIAVDSINRQYDPHPPNTHSFDIDLIEYSTFYKKFFNNSSASSYYKHGPDSYTSYYGSDSYNFSNSMRYFFYDSEYRKTEQNISRTNEREQFLFDNKKDDTLSYYHYYVKYDDYSGGYELEKEGKYSHVISFSKDEQLYALNRDDTLFIYDINNGNLLETILLPFASSYDHKLAIEFSSDNNIIYVATSRYLYVIDVATKDVSRMLTIPELERNAMITTHPTDVSKLAIISNDNAILCDIDFEAKPYADFQFIPNSWEITLQTIDTLHIINYSIGQNLEYEWDFGDGYISKEETPSHSYEQPGEYSVKLTVTNENGTDDTTHSKNIHIVEQQLFADFEIEYDDSKFPIQCNLTDKSIGDNYSIAWFINNERSNNSNNTHSFLIECPGKYPVKLQIKRDNFSDIKYDTVVIEANYSKIDNLVNEQIISTNHKLETYNILEYDNNYYFNFVYDSVEVGYVSEIYKMDKDFNYNRQMRFQGYSYPPYEPVIYNDNLVFKYDSSLSMNDLSYLGTDFEGNIEFNYSEMFEENGSIKYTENQINTTKLKIYNDSLYVLSTYGYSNESANSYLYKLNTENYEPVLFDSLTYYRNYDTDFFINNDNKIAYSYNHFYIVEQPPYKIMENRVKFGDFQKMEYRYWNNKIRLNNNWFSDTLIVALYCIEDNFNKIVQYDIQNNTTYIYKLSKSSKLNQIFRKGDSLYIAGCYEYEAAFYIYNLITLELTHYPLKNRIGEFTDLNFNDKGNLMLFGKLNNNLNDKIYIAEYDFDLTDNSSDTTSVEQPEEPKDITDIVSFYPNPATEELLIKYMSEDNEPIEIHVLDMTGRELFAATINAVEGENDYYLQIDHIAPGVYLLNIKTPSGIISRKFVKE